MAHLSKKSPLLMLPAELRNSIYEYVFLNEERTIQAGTLEMAYNLNMHFPTHYTGNEWWSWILVCRQVCNEAKHLLFANQAISFYHPRELTSLFAEKSGPAAFHKIESLIIDVRQCDLSLKDATKGAGSLRCLGSLEVRVSVTASDWESLTLGNGFRALVKFQLRDLGLERDLELDDACVNDDLNGIHLFDSAQAEEMLRRQKHAIALEQKFHKLLMQLLHRRRSHIASYYRGLELAGAGVVAH